VIDGPILRGSARPASIPVNGSGEKEGTEMKTNVGILAVLLILVPAMAAAAPGATGADPVSGDDDGYYLDDQVNGLENEFLIKHLPGSASSVLDDYVYHGRYSSFDLAKSIGEADERDVNQYMIGSISVIVVLPESNSNGPNTEDWTDEEIEAVHNEITTGLSWWADREPAADLEFHYTFHDRVDIEGEAISQDSFDPWIVWDLTEALGYPIQDNDYWGSWLDLINDKRIEQDTDWGFLIFVVDSSNDADGKFADGYSAFVPGLGPNGINPYMVMTYDNGNWGIEHMEDISAHEMGHIFGAQDEYSQSGCSCESHSGYLYYENQNCANGCLLDEPSIMKYQAIGYANNAVDVYARGQIGWQDLDNDGILDILDTVPSLTMNFSESPEPLRFRFTGYAQVNCMEAVNTYYRSGTINTIDRVEYRVAGGPWLEAVAVDGVFDGQEEDYLVDVTIQGGYNSLLECRAWNSAGNASVISSAVLDGVTAVPPAVRRLALRANPNPFNPRTTIRFRLDETASCALTVHDIGGRVVRTLVDGNLSAGEHAVDWDGRGRDGRPAPSGAYFVRLETAEGVATTRVLLAK
jgi:hypothetical protein